ncbi:DUF4274 domain-containing protein [Emticicia oligotrophica]|uniref:DUF4274 domain-containing protein n=1 Tax=Emticicia oligotrophica TaxID=312279 RepID=UPI00273B9F4C|nr:DUF4274 domain-containing protein [Emticicia oligotrophica]
MLKLLKSQINYIEDKIIDAYDNLSEKQMLNLENSDDEDAELTKIQLKNFEKLSTSEELHYLIKKWNWDDGYEIPQKVLSHPLCDKGTALMIYWLATPDYFTKFENEEEVPTYNRENYRLVINAENLLLNNAFKLQNIKFNPKSVASWMAINDLNIHNELKIESEGYDFTF